MGWLPSSRGVRRLSPKGLSRILGGEKRRDFSHRRKQAVLGFRLAQHRLFRPVRSKPAKNPGQTRPSSWVYFSLGAK